VAKADSARSETLINKLITSKAKKEKELADVIDTFDDSGSSTDSLRIKNQIDKIESKLVELTGVGGTDSTSFDASYQKPSTVKKQSWISKMMWGTEEEQEKNAWIDSYIQQDRISAANGESGVPRKSRTNQWYAQRAEEAYAEKMKIKDPAGLAPYIKTGDSQAPAIRGIQAPAIGDTTTYTSPDGGYKETKVRIRPEQHNLNVDKWKERIDAETDPVRKNALERYRDMGFAP